MATGLEESWTNSKRRPPLPEASQSRLTSQRWQPRQPQNTPTRSRARQASDSVLEDAEPSPMIKQPEIRPISQEQLVAEVKGIYAGLVMVESKCVDVDNAQNAQNENQPRLNNEQWQALIALHRTLLYEHHDFFLASQHPSASPSLRRLASKYSMPAHMWRHGIHSFLELLRHRLPQSLEHMLTFIYLAYSMMALLYETVPAFEDTWIECLGDLGRYRMAIEDDDIRDREVWTEVSRHWYAKASEKAPTTGRLYHHLAILARPNAVQQLFYYVKSLAVPMPILSARESILNLFDPIMSPLSGKSTKEASTDVFKNTTLLDKQASEWSPVSALSKAATFAIGQLPLAELQFDSRQRLQSRPLPEDWSLRGLLYAEKLYPEDWFQTKLDDDEKLYPEDWFQTKLDDDAKYFEVPSRGESRQLLAKGEFNGQVVDANVDTGSGFNIISQDLAESLNLRPKPGTHGYVPIGSGKRLYSLGQVDGTFRFSGETTLHSLRCVILKKTKHALVLGSRFLRVTQTMKKYVSRIRTVFSNVLSLKLAGGEQDLLSGYLNDQECSVVPDTGSDIMAMSRSYARKLGLKILRGRRHMCKVQYVDGSRAFTNGVVKNVRWKFRQEEAPILCDFHIIDNLPVNALVSNAFLDKFDVFAEYEDLIVEQESEENEAGIYGISLLEKYRDEIRSLEDQYIEDMTSADPFTLEMVDRERARRDEIRDRINKIPKKQRGPDKLKEKARQRQWAKLKHDHDLIQSQHQRGSSSTRQ